MKEGKGGSAESMHPAALNHEHSKSHHVGRAFSQAHGHSHEGMAPAASAGPSDASVNAPQGAPAFDGSQQ
jgi:hypothetical protein